MKYLIFFKRQTIKGNWGTNTIREGYVVSFAQAIIASLDKTRAMEFTDEEANYFIKKYGGIKEQVVDNSVK